MNKFKSFTSIEQSKKLAEILPLESADMSWYKEIEMFPFELHSLPYFKHFVMNDGSDKLLPCWSLAALLDVLPNKLKIALAINVFQGDRKEKYVIGSVEHDKYDCYADNPIDACYELILKLNKLKLM